MIPGRGTGTLGRILFDSGGDSLEFGGRFRTLEGHSAFCQDGGWAVEVVNYSLVGFQISMIN